MDLASRLSLIHRGVLQIITEADLRQKLQTGRPLIIKAGLDHELAAGGQFLLQLSVGDDVHTSPLDEAELRGEIHPHEGWVLGRGGGGLSGWTGREILVA